MAQIYWGRTPSVSCATEGERVFLRRSIAGSGPGKMLLGGLTLSCSIGVLVGGLAPPAGATPGSRAAFAVTTTQAADNLAAADGLVTAMANCSSTKKSSKWVTARGNYFRWYYRVEQGRGVIDYPRRYVRKNVKVGKVKVIFLACKSRSSGKWSILSYQFAGLKNYDVKVTTLGDQVTTEPAVGKWGFEISPRRVAKPNPKEKTLLDRGKPKVVIDPLACYEDPKPLKWQKLIKGVVGLPLPVPYWTSAGQYLASKALPDAPANTYYCGRLGYGKKKTPIKMAVRFRKNGTVTFITGKNRTTRSYYQSSRREIPQSCSDYACAEVRETQIILTVRR